MLQKYQKTNQLVINKYLPHNFLAEKMILSCLLVNSEAIEITSRVLSIEAFYFKNHQELYKAIKTMHTNKISVDILTLLVFLQDKACLEKVGGIKVLIELISQIPNIIYLEEYINLVKDKFIRRSLIKLGYQAINSGHITTIPLEQMLNEFETKLFNLTNEIRLQQLFSSAELLNNIFYELREKSFNPSFSGLASGFHDLDSLTQGFQKSDLIIIAARPSMGKTALGLNIAINVIKASKLPVIFFSLEMSKEQIMYRLLAMEANINQMRLKSGKLYQNDWIKLNKIIKIISKLPLFIDDTSTVSVQDIRSKLKILLFQQNQIGLVIVDYLQLMQNSKSKNENRVQELSNITRLLKTIAREFKVPIIALSQLSRNVENRLDKKPILSDLRESGSIEQDADLVLMLYKNQYANHSLLKETSLQLVELIIAKQRNGPVGSIELQFNPKQTRFSSLFSKNHN